MDQNDGSVQLSCKLRYNKCFKTLLQTAMFVRSSSVTMATVFLVATCAMDIVHAVMEATNETVVSVHGNTVSAVSLALLALAVTGDDYNS